MNIYLCGQKYFGMLVLDLLRQRGHTVIGVSAPPTTRGGGTDRLWARAEHYDIPRREAGTLNADTLPAGVDLIVAAHSHDFIGRRTRLRARLGAIGYHPSLLPLHRGRDAVRWTLKMGDKIAGGSVYWLNDTVDGGPIAAQDWCFVPPRATAETLWREHLQPLGVRLFERVLGNLERGYIVQVPQDPALATWEPSLDQAPLYRPDLLMLGGAIPGYTVVRNKDAAGALSLPAAYRGEADITLDDDDYLACV